MHAVSVVFSGFWGENQYFELRDTDWWGKAWTLQTSELSCRVSDGGPVSHDDLLEQLNVTIGNDAVADIACGLSNTYVSLEIGKPFCRERNRQVCRRCHITIAYVAAMSNRQKADLQGPLDHPARTASNEP